MKYLALAFVLISAILTGCSDDTTSSNNPVAEGDYFPLALHNQWKYKTEDSTATRTVIDDASIVNGISYYLVYDASNGDSIRFRQSGTSYFTRSYDELTQSSFEYKFADKILNASWTENLTVLGISVSFSFKTTEIGITRTVNGTPYSNVIHIHADATTPFGPATQDLYLAKGIGIIEDVESGVSSESLVNYHVN